MKPFHTYITCPWSSLAICKASFYFTQFMKYCFIFHSLHAVIFNEEVGNFILSNRKCYISFFRWYVIVLVQNNMYISAFEISAQHHTNVKFVKVSGMCEEIVWKYLCLTLYRTVSSFPFEIVVLEWNLLFSICLFFHLISPFFPPFIQGPMEVALIFLDGDDLPLDKHRNKLRLCLKELSRRWVFSGTHFRLHLFG